MHDALSYSSPCKHDTRAACWHHSGLLLHQIYHYIRFTWKVTSQIRYFVLFALLVTISSCRATSDPTSFNPAAHGFMNDDKGTPFDITNFPLGTPDDPVNYYLFEPARINKKKPIRCIMHNVPRRRRDVNRLFDIHKNLSASELAIDVIISYFFKLFLKEQRNARRTLDPDRLPKRQKSL